MNYYIGKKLCGCNMKYLHRKAAGKQKKNKIKYVKKEDLQITKNKREMEAMACNFFKELYTADPSMQPDDVLNLFQPKITDETNGNLCRDFTDDEISDMPCSR
jgi:hypothetical protein